MIDDTLLEAEEKMDRAIAHAKEEFGTMITRRASVTALVAVAVAGLASGCLSSGGSGGSSGSIAVPEPATMKRTFPTRSISPGSASSASWKPFS